jgi:ADP-heptose:LPS heptosyltransferase
MKRKALFRFLDRYFGIPILIILALIFKRKNRLPIENIKKILIIKLAAIGDTILIIPMLRLLKKKFPDSEVVFMCSPINEDIIKKIPYIDSIMMCDVHSFLYNPIKFLSFIKLLRKNLYDLIIDAGQWERINAIFTALSRNHFSVGFKTKRQNKHFIYDKVVSHLRERNELEMFLDLLEPIGITVSEEDKKLEYFLSADNKSFAGKFWQDNGLVNKKVICLHPGCGENGKPREWSNENYIELGKRLIEYDPQIKLLLSGTKSDIPRNEIIEKGISNNVINSTGKFTLNDVVALVEKCSLIVCSNTGMLHIAGCVYTKTMGLHGPTNPKKWGSYSKIAVLIQSDKFCSPCLYLGHDYGCKTPTCMKHIGVDDVFIYIRKALNPELFEEHLRV